MATVVPVITFPFETSLDVAVTTWAPMAATTRNSVKLA